MPEASVAFNESGKDRRRFQRHHLIIAAVVIILLAIILAVSLAVVLQKDGNTDSTENQTHKFDGRPVLLVSFDGFRSEYLTRGLTPNIDKFGKTGVQAKFMLSQFPTKTFPNHYTIVTGLYPESHGIVFNSFYDPILRKRFSIRYSRNPAFWSGEPIWMTAMKNGMKTASYYWVGSEIKGFRPTYYKVYNHSVPFSAKLEQVMKWLRLPGEERPSFITLYHHEPDSTGHKFGPDSEELNKQLKIVDGYFGELLTALDEAKMSNSINLILVSDHGMSATNCSNAIFLDKYDVLQDRLYFTNLGSVASFKMKTKGDDVKILNNIKCVNDSFQAFNKKNLPKRMHFSNNRRIDDIVVIPDQGELVYINSTADKYCSNGSHGYDNIDSDMSTIFMANGPSFEKGKTVEHFQNIEIYNLLAGLLKVKPAPNNGTVGSLNSLLVHETRPVVPKQNGDGNAFRTDVCPFPNDETLKARSKCCNCSGCDILNSSIAELNEVFNITTEQAKAYQDTHLPWGLPDGGAGTEGCLLTQPHFITGYSTYLRIPLWAASRVNGTVKHSSSPKDDCLLLDVRLKQSQTGNCESYPGSIFRPGQLVSSEDLENDTTAAFSSLAFSNIIPQYSNFNEGIWRRLERLVREWAVEYKSLYVISGSIFDANADGKRDDDKTAKKRTRDNPKNPAVPTHFYKIITRCNVTMKSDYTVPECTGSLQVISFILRNTDEVCSFHKSRKILLQNVARVKDIELLTGINFFSKLPNQLQAEIKTFQPVKLWGQP